MSRYFPIGLFALTLYQGPVSVSAQPVQCDRACVRTVRVLLQAEESGFYLSWLEKANRQLGDSVSVGLRKILTRRNISRPTKVRLFLPIILEAFKDTEMISKPENKTPTATMQLLTTLKRKVRNASLREEISKTMDEIQRLANRDTSIRAP